MKNLAIDLGASSGRHIVYSDGKLTEVHRFKNGMDKVDGKTVWDTERLFKEIVEGIKIAIKKFGKIDTLAIDTWGVDYVLLKGDEEVFPVYAYRDERTLNSIDKVHDIIPFPELYKKTGIQFQPFNTIYQLYDDKLKGRLDGVTDFLMIPEYFSYKLTGIKKKEYTEASTSGLVNAYTKEFDKEITDKLGLPEVLFKKLNQPGEVVGQLKDEIVKEVGGNITVKLCASHDTASAFEAVDVDDKSVILSSGTWSLIGTKNETPLTGNDSLNANFTNEGGVGYIRFLKNIMGMWLVNRTIAEKNIGIVQMIEKAKASEYDKTFDVNDDSLIAPENMSNAIVKLLGEKDLKDDDLFSSILKSLAKSYAFAVDELEKISNKKYDKIYIVGGGAKNQYLNELTEKYSKKKVIAIPIEATSIGNINIQRGEKIKA